MLAFQSRWCKFVHVLFSVLPSSLLMLKAYFYTTDCRAVYDRFKNSSSASRSNLAGTAHDLLRNFLTSRLGPGIDRKNCVRHALDIRATHAINSLRCWPVHESCLRVDRITRETANPCKSCLTDTNSLMKEGRLLWKPMPPSAGAHGIRMLSLVAKG